MRLSLVWVSIAITSCNVTENELKRQNENSQQAPTHTNTEVQDSLCPAIASVDTAHVFLPANYILKSLEGATLRKKHWNGQTFEGAYFEDQGTYINTNPSFLMKNSEVYISKKAFYNKNSKEAWYAYEIENPGSSLKVSYVTGFEFRDNSVVEKTLEKTFTPQFVQTKCSKNLVDTQFIVDGPTFISQEPLLDGFDVESENESYGFQFKLTQSGYREHRLKNPVALIDLQFEKMIRGTVEQKEGVETVSGSGDGAVVSYAGGERVLVTDSEKHVIPSLSSPNLKNGLSIVASYTEYTQLTDPSTHTKYFFVGKQKAQGPLASE